MEPQIANGLGVTHNAHVRHTSPRIASTSSGSGGCESYRRTEVPWTTRISRKQGRSLISCQETKSLCWRRGLTCSNLWRVISPR